MSLRFFKKYFPQIFSANFCKQYVEGFLLSYEYAQFGILRTCSWRQKIPGIKVLNINELFLALRPFINPGDVLKIQMVKEGKE